MGKIIYVILLVFTTCTVFSQQITFKSDTLKSKDLPELKIKEQKLDPVLDNIITYEKECPYYSDSICFVLNVTKNNVIINSFNSEQVSSTYIGYFYYQNHLFFVVSRLFPESLFEKTKQFRTFIKESPSLIIDDSFSQWIYYFNAESFMLLGYQHCNGEYIEIVPLQGKK